MHLGEGNLCLDCETTDTLVIIKTLKNYLKKTKVKKTNYLMRQTAISLWQAPKKRNHNTGTLLFLPWNSKWRNSFYANRNCRNLTQCLCQYDNSCNITHNASHCDFALKIDVIEPCWVALMCLFKLNKPNYLTWKLCHLWCGKANAIKVSQMY